MSLLNKYKNNKMEGLFGRRIRKTTVKQSMLAVGIAVTTVIKTDTEKHIILLEDGTMITTYQPIVDVVSIEQVVEFIPEEEILDIMIDIDNNKSIDEIMMQRLFNKLS